MKKLIAALALSAASVGTVVAAPAVAEAAPYGCYWASTVYNSSGQMTGRMSRCSFGNGYFRTRLTCSNGSRYYGPWRSPGGSSSVQCPSGRYVTNSVVEVSN